MKSYDPSTLSPTNGTHAATEFVTIMATKIVNECSMQVDGPEVGTVGYYPLSSDDPRQSWPVVVHNVEEALLVEEGLRQLPE